MPDSLDLFHPLIREWFRETLGEPTHVQQAAWPKIASHEHLLVTAPTGSGKTLTAFLWSIHQFVAGVLDPGHTRILYVSPLKALNNDIQRNLTTPLEELERRFSDASLPFPRIGVATRSGDTDPFARRQMLRHPPEILITTPESLNLLLSSRGGRTLLAGLATVILDEIHSLVDSKRGAYLMSAVERLVPLTGEFQRLALSATVNPLEQVAEMVGGYAIDTRRDLEEASYRARPVTIVRARDEKRYEVEIRYPEASATRPMGEKIWDSLSVDFTERIAANRSTLLFANSRVLCEKLTHKINETAGELVAYSHHGSLSREIRTAVESRFKEGDLKAIVATSSLEMGIDIGDLDEVLLVQSPGSISSAIQRVGRAGHHVGETSRGTLYPTHPQDFIESAVLAAAMRSGDIEPRQPVECPLDVLAQVIISMVAMETWNLDGLYDRLRCCYSFHRLGRHQYDLVLDMLAGRYAESRIQELRPRISIDRLDGSATARPGALLALYLSGGVIPDRGYYQLRHADTDARLGELDEEFVWEARPGQIFTLGTQQWQIQRITHNDVRVTPARATSSTPPFWKAESLNRDYHFSQRIGEFLERMDACVGDEHGALALLSTFGMDDQAARALLRFLREQRAHCRCPLPHRHHLLAERAETLPGNASGRQIILHTLWGARVNRPFALALEAAWQERFGTRIEIYVTNDCLVLQMPHEIDGREIFSLVPAARVEELIRRRLEGSGFFAARFRECAGRALLLSKKRFNERKPLWMSRLQSQKLMDAALRYEDFPMLLETWRTCLRDEFDLAALHRVLEEVAAGEIRVSDAFCAAPSPMAQNLSWSQINVYMYQEDEAPGHKASNLAPSLLSEILRTPELRPAIPRSVIREFELKRKRLAPGYGPQSARELLDWLIERVAVPFAEWRELLSAMAAEHGRAWCEECVRHIETRAVRARREAVDLVLPLENLGPFLHALYGTAQTHAHFTLVDLAGAPVVQDGSPAAQDSVDAPFPSIQLANWLQSYGPVTAREIERLLGVDTLSVANALTELLDDGTLISGQLIEDSEELSVCDAGNLEVLLRMVRQRSRPVVEPLPLTRLPLLLHCYSVAEAGDEMDKLRAAVEALRALRAPAHLWESELLPARVPGYKPVHLDQLFQEGAITWIGRGAHDITLCFADDLDLLARVRSTPADGADVERLLPDPIGRYDYPGLMSRTDWPQSRLSARVWELAFDGALTNDTFAALRQGIDTDFKGHDLAPSAPRGPGAKGDLHRRRAYSGWRTAAPYGGNWMRVPVPPSPADPVEAEEINRERVRVLLDRYGILFRELIQREEHPFRWTSLLRSLRLMEMSGELLSGYFVEGIPGPQFVSHRMFRLLQTAPDRDRVFWVNASDPMSLCGVALPALKGSLPRRVASNHLVYRGESLVILSRRNGSDLEFRAPPDDPGLPECLVLLDHLLHRARMPVRQLRIETINGRPAPRSPYVDVLRAEFDTVADYRVVTLHRKL